MLSLIEQNDGCVPQEKLKCVRQVVEEGSKHLLVKRQSITLVDPWWDASVIHPGRGVNNMLDHIDFLRPVRFHLSKLRLGTFISCAADRAKAAKQVSNGNVVIASSVLTLYKSMKHGFTFIL